MHDANRSFDDVAAYLSDEAATRGCDKAELASFLLKQGLEKQQDPQLSAEDQAMLLRRLSDPAGAAYVTSEEVDAKFEALFAELRAR